MSDGALISGYLNEARRDERLTELGSGYAGVEKESYHPETDRYYDATTQTFSGPTAEEQTERDTDVRRSERFEVFSRTLDRLNPIWYRELDTTERGEIRAWRQAWLDSPETGITPALPQAFGGLSAYELEGVSRTRTVKFNGKWRIIVFFSGDAPSIPGDYSSATVVVGENEYEVDLTDFTRQSDRWVYLFDTFDGDAVSDTENPMVTINPAGVVVEPIEELVDPVEELTEQVTSLKQMVAALTDRIATLEGDVDTIEDELSPTIPLTSTILSWDDQGSWIEVEVDDYSEFEEGDIISLDANGVLRYLVDYVDSSLLELSPVVPDTNPATVFVGRSLWKVK